MWQLLTAAVPSIVRGIAHSKNKPKKSDYKANTEGMRKYVSFLRGKKGTNQVMDQAMRPALRTIGQAGGRAQREIGYGAARSGVAGSGIEAAQREGARQTQRQELQAVGERASAAQMAADASTEEKVQKAYGDIDTENKRAQDAYSAAQRQHKQQMNQIWAQGIGSVATAGLGMAQQASADKALSGRAEAYATEFKGEGKGYGSLSRSGYSDQDIINRFSKQAKQAGQLGERGATITDIFNNMSDEDRVRFEEFQKMREKGFDYNQILQNMGDK